jgi:hypothetical protein
VPMKSEPERSSERRWVVVATNGQYVTLGRHSDPSEEEISAVERALRLQNLSGWLAIMEGSPWVGGAPRLLEVRPLASPVTIFEDAAQACIAAILAKRAEASE